MSLTQRLGKTATNRRTGKRRRFSMPWSGPAKRQRDAPQTGCKHKHSRPCLPGRSQAKTGVLMCQTRENPALRDYYGHYSPARRGINRGNRKKNDQDELIVGKEGQSPARRAYAPEGPPPKTNAPQPNVHIDKSARPGATTLYVQICQRLNPIVPTVSIGFVL